MSGLSMSYEIAYHKKHPAFILNYVVKSIRYMVFPSMARRPETHGAVGAFDATREPREDI